MTKISKKGKLEYDSYEKEWILVSNVQDKYPEYSAEWHEAHGKTEVDSLEDILSQFQDKKVRISVEEV